MEHRVLYLFKAMSSWGDVGKRKVEICWHSAPPSHAMNMPQCNRDGHLSSVKGTWILGCFHLLDIESGLKACCGVVVDGTCSFEAQTCLWVMFFWKWHSARLNWKVYRKGSGKNRSTGWYKSFSFSSPKGTSSKHAVPKQIEIGSLVCCFLQIPEVEDH